jgi:glycosyltransferase involved in cell wall biosynthesis
MTLPSVSVVIPVKDDARELAKCLEALGRQTVAALEILVIDNGSTDDSAAVGVRFGARVLSQPEPGIPATAAFGYDAASGTVIARCDADSLPGVDWIERLATAFVEHPGIVAVTGPGDFPDLTPVKRRLADVAYMGAYFTFVGFALAQPPVFGSNFAMTSAVWREVRNRVHRDDRRVHDDFDLSVQFGPLQRVLLDSTLRLPISSRPFTSVRSMIKRTFRGSHTVWVNAARLRPIHRRWARWRARPA